MYSIPHSTLGEYPPNNSSNQLVPTGLPPRPTAASVAMMGQTHVPFTGRYEAEPPPSDFSAANEGVFHARRRYTSPHPYGNSSHTSIHRPASLRHSVRNREGPSTSARLRSTRESYPWVHTSGPEMPHPAASTSATPAQQDFRTLPDPQTPLADNRDESTEPETSIGAGAGAAAAATLHDTTATTTNATATPVYENASGTPPSLAPLRTLEDMHEYFPHQNPLHERMRVRILEVINSTWRRMNEKEPDPQALLQFTTKVEEKGLEKYRCLIWAEGTECGKKIPR